MVIALMLLYNFFNLVNHKDRRDLDLSFISFVAVCVTVLLPSCIEYFVSVRDSVCIKQCLSSVFCPVCQC